MRKAFVAGFRCCRKIFDRGEQKMDCPHIGDNVVLRRNAVKNLKQTLFGGLQSAALSGTGTPPVIPPAAISKLWKCAGNLYHSEWQGYRNFLEFRNSRAKEIVYSAKGIMRCIISLPTTDDSENIIGISVS